MAKQVRSRRDTYSNLQTVTPVAGEIGYDTTNKRVIVGDGATPGGIPVPNYLDAIANSFSYALAVESSANVYTLTLPISLAAYSAGQVFWVKYPTANTGSTTLNISGLGAKTLKKKSGPSITNLVANDIVADVLYPHVYDGTNIQVIGVGTGLTSISQGDLNTSISAQSSSATSGNVILPGGEYGFYPQIKTSGTPNVSFGISNGYNNSSYVTVAGWSMSAGTNFIQQRYITSSPPFDLGGGEVAGFIFLEVNPQGEVISTYSSDTPPWVYNGPTNVRASFIDGEGNKFRRVLKKKDIRKIISGEEDIEESLELITHSLKNKDMDLIPHPFISKPKENTVVLLDSMCPKIRRIIDLQNKGEDLTDLIRSITPNNDGLKRKGPRGLMQCKYHL